MATRWERKLRSFQQSLEAFRTFTQVDLRYGVVHVHGPLPDPDEPPRTAIYATGGTLAESLIVPITADEYQLHLLFGMDFAPVRSEVLTQFKSQLRELHDIFPILPKWVPIPSTLPALANGGDENLVRWGLTLLSLGATEQNVFHCETEFAESASSFQINGRVTPWENLSPIPGFDPIEFVTRRGKPTQEWRYWNQEHAIAERAFPEVLAVSLTKPIFYASVNAVDLLIQIGLELRPKSNPKRRPGIITRDGTTLTDGDRSVLSALRQHHQSAGEGQESEPLKQREIAEMAGVDQVSVHRTLKAHLCRFPACGRLSAKKCYEKLCREGLIVGILDQIENPQRREELTNIQKIERFEANDEAEDE